MRSKIVFVCLLLTSCAFNQDDRLIGVWIKVTGGFDSATLEFFSDETCFLEEASRRRACTWTFLPDGRGKLQMDVHGTPAIGIIQLEGDTLSLELSSKDTSQWVRQGTQAAERSRLDDLYFKAVEQLQMGEQDKAASLLVQLEESNDTSPKALSLLGNFYLWCWTPGYCDPQKALSYADKAVAQRRSYDNLALLASAYDRVGRAKKARQTMKEALDLLASADFGSEELRETIREQFEAELDEFGKER